jgi:predicted ester cyclase
MDVADRELRVRTFVEEVWNKRNYDAAEDLYAETYANGFGTRPSARVEPIRRYHDAFPDLRITVEELICSQDTVVLRCAFRGTDTGGYVGRAPTGRAVDEWAITILHFDGDKVVREWVGADKLGLFIQLGWSKTRGRNRDSRVVPSRVVVRGLAAARRRRRRTGWSPIPPAPSAGSV